MGRKFYTIMVVPHAAAKFRRLRLSKRFLIVSGSLVGAVLLAGLMLPHFVLRSSQLRTQLERVAVENAQLKKVNEKIDASLTELRSKLAEFETKATKLALMVGVEDINAQQMGAGGSSFDLRGMSPRASQSILEGEIRTLRKRSGALQDSFRILDMAFQKQAMLLSSTPSIFPVRGLMGNGYGWRRDPFTGMRDFHQGLDIVAPMATKVVSPADGIVTRAGRMGGFGTSIFVSHGYGIVTRYGHLKTANVKVGQRVKRGDVIGQVGSSGRSTGPHLHYEVIVHQRNVDPVKYILQEFRSF